MMRAVALPAHLAGPQEALLGLLLNDPRVDPDDLDWSAMPRIAEREGLLLRLAAWFEQRHEQAPERVASAAAGARARLERLHGFIAAIEQRCVTSGIPYVFLRVAQQYPDVGRDVDLLIPFPDAGRDRAFCDVRDLSRPRNELRDRLAGTTAYVLPGCDATLVIHHGRVGRFGEHARYARRLLHRRRRRPLATGAWHVPSPEDALLLEVLHRLYGQAALKMRDAHWVITTIRETPLDWDKLIATARDTGLLEGLSCYLTYLDQIQRHLLDRPLLRNDIRARLAAGPWGRLQFRDGVYCFPAARVTGRLYAREFWTDVATGDWEAASRLCMLPVVAAAAGYRRLTQPTLGGR